MIVQPEDLDLALLESKIRALESIPRLRVAAVHRLAALVRTIDDWGALRVNPIRFADENGLSATEATDLFVHAAKVGLFDVVWNLICPSCGAIVVSQSSMVAMQARRHCATCDSEVEGSLDDQVEAGFALNQSVGRIRVDPYGSAEDYWRYAFSPNVHDTERVTELKRAAVLGLELTGPDDDATFVLDAARDDEYRLVSVERNGMARLVTKGDGAATVAFDLVPPGIFPAEAVVAPGRVSISVRNLFKTASGVALVRRDPAIRAAIAVEPPRRGAFLTGKMLLNNQSFRELFRVNQLVPELGLPIRHLTLLFSDLKGSTALYDRTGDAHAFALVRSLYRQLAEAVRENSGAIVKTMGDAIMASFSHPLDAVRAAVDMVERVDGQELGLKVGLHEGPALVVDADDRLDYFGQTVNIAARVQGLADAGEIWHTDALLDVDGIEGLLRSHGFSDTDHAVRLKGVGAPVRVRQWRRAAVPIRPQGLDRTDARTKDSRDRGVYRRRGR